MKQRKQITVTSDWIQNYANSIQAPIQKRNGKLVAPSTMPILFWQSFQLPIFQDSQAVLHGSQQFLYKKPIEEGMVLECELSLTNKEQKQGKVGQLTFLSYSLICREKDETVMESNTVLIQVGE